MYKFRGNSWITIAIGLVLALLCSSLLAMTWHVSMPWQNETYATKSNQFVFFSRQSATLLFDKEKEIQIACQPMLPPIALNWSVARNSFKQPLMMGVGEPQLSNGFLIRIPTAKLKPGFYDISVTLNTGVEKEIHGACTFGWRVGELHQGTWRPADFESVWNGAKAELDRTPLDAKVTGPVRVMGDKEINDYNPAYAGMPPDYDPTGHKASQVEVYKVNFAAAEGARCYGWLTKPVGKGPFPAMLIVPGATGPSGRPIPAEHARHGYLAMAIQVFGQDVDLEKYSQPEYPAPGPGPKKDHFMYRMYTNVWQSINYLASRPDVDPNKIVVVGQSQGGRLSVIAGTHPKVAAIVPCLAHYGDWPYRKWSEAANNANPQLDGMNMLSPPVPADNEDNRLLAYYDTMNFAPDVKCPVFMYGGMIDYVSPVTTVFSTFQLLGSKDKQLVLGPNLFHEWNPEFDRRAWRWLDEKLGNR